MLKDSKVFSHYKILRGHPSLLNRIRTQRLTPPSLIQSHLITSTHHSHRFTLNHNNSQLFAYDDFTYSQVHFNQIHSDQEIQQPVGALDANNQLFIHLTEDNDSTFTLQSKQLLESLLQNPELEMNNMGFIESLAKTLYDSKQQDETIVISVIGFSSETEVSDLLDFNHFHEKVRVSKVKSEIIVSNLTQMIVKDFQSFLEVISISTNLESCENSKAIVYKLEVVKLQEGEELAVESVRKKVNIIKLFGHSPNYINVVGRVLHEITQGEQSPINIRSSKLTTFVNQSLNPKTPIKVIIQINPQKQQLKTIISLLGFCDYFQKRLVLRKNYFGNEFVMKRMNKHNLSVTKTWEEKQEPTKFPRLQSLMTETLSSVSKRKPTRSQVSLEPIVKKPKRQHRLRKIYNQV